MEKALETLRLFRSRLALPVDGFLDPNATGIIGLEYSDLTTTTGALTAKRTSCNPAFAALVARLLLQAGCARGDAVSVCFTGSFPALNVAVLSACAALGLEARIISSVGASSYGANIPGFTWLDMEKELRAAGVFPYISVAVSYGGVVETGGGLDGTGLILAGEAVSRHGAPLLEEGDYRDAARMAEHRKKILDAPGRPVCHINVGGALAALGWVPEAAHLDNGLLRKIPSTQDPARGLIFRYMEEGIPVIHLLQVERLAARHALPYDPVPLPDAEECLETGARKRAYLLLAALLCAWTLASLLLLRREYDLYDLLV
jgi:poly-gamma-glutamate system protein